MVQGKHSKPSKWKRKVLGLPVIGWLFALSGVALAVAGFIVLLGTTGSVTAGNEVDVIYRSGTPSFIIDSENMADCSISRTSDSEINITATDVFPGGTCDFRVAVQNDGLEDAAIQAWRSSDAAVVGTLGAVCGATIGNSGGFNNDIVFTLTFNPTAGQVINFNPAVDGLEFVAASLYNPGDCA